MSQLADGGGFSTSYVDTLRQLLDATASSRVLLAADGLNQSIEVKQLLGLKKELDVLRAHVNAELSPNKMYFNGPADAKRTGEALARASLQLQLLTSAIFAGGALGDRAIHSALSERLKELRKLYRVGRNGDLTPTSSYDLKLTKAFYDLYRLRAQFRSGAGDSLEQLDTVENQLARF